METTQLENHFCRYMYPKNLEKTLQKISSSQLDIHKQKF